MSPQRTPHALRPELVAQSEKEARMGNRAWAAVEIFKRKPAVARERLKPRQPSTACCDWRPESASWAPNADEHLGAADTLELNLLSRASRQGKKLTDA